MRIVSRLMKTDIVLDSIKRQEDRILLLSPPDDWNDTKVYLSPEDVVNTVRLSLNRGMVLYALLFPFFLISHYLRTEKEINKHVFNIGYIVAAIFMGLLLLGGMTFLMVEPLVSTIVLGVLAGLFYLISINTKKPGFLYLAVPLTVVAFFLLAYGQSVEIHQFPWLALGIVLTLLILGKALSNENEEKMAQPLNHVSTLVVLIFVVFLAFNASAYALEDPWGASLPLLGFALFHFVRYLDTREVFQHYAAMILLVCGFVMGLYGIPIIPAYYGLPMIALSMAMIMIADRYHEAHGFAHVAPAYSLGILLALFAFVYAWQDLSALLLSLALFSVHFFGGTHSLGVKSTADDLAEKIFQWIEFSLANIAAGLAAALIFTIGRTNWAAIIAAAVYVYFYRKMGFGREPTILVTRNQYLWAAGGFYSLFIFVVLGVWDPFGNAQLDMYLVPPLLLPALFYARYVFKQGQEGPAASIYESTLLTIVSTLLLPTLLGDFQIGAAALIGFILLLIYGLLWYLWRDEVLLYPLPVILANLYYVVLTAVGVGDPALGLMYLPFGLLAMGFALYLLRRGSGPVRVFFLSWFVFSSISIVGVMSDRNITVILIAGWAALYVLTSSIINQSETTQQIIEAESHV